MSFNPIEFGSVSKVTGSPTVVLLKNVGTEDIPAWSIAEIVSTEFDLSGGIDSPASSGGLIVNVQRPTRYLPDQLATSMSFPLEPGDTKPGLMGSILAVQGDFEQGDRINPTKDSFAYIKGFGPLHCYGVQAGDDTTLGLFHYDPAALDQVEVCVGEEAFPAAPKGCNKSLPSRECQVLYSNAGTLVDLGDETLFVYNAGKEIPANSNVPAHRNINGDYLLSSSAGCEGFVGTAYTSIPEGESGLVKQCDTDPPEYIEGLNVGGFEIAQGCKVQAIPKECDGDCTYDFIGIRDLDFSCFHNERVFRRTYITPAVDGYYAHNVYALREVKEEDCSVTFCLGPEFEIVHYYPCCYPCFPSCYTFALDKRAQDTVNVCWHHDGQTIPGSVNVGTVDFGGVHTIALQAVCGFFSDSDYECNRVYPESGGWRDGNGNFFDNICEAALSGEPNATLVECSPYEFECPGLECESQKVADLEALGWVKVGETAEACIFAGCTTCPDDTLLPGTETSWGTLQPGNPCDLYPHAGIDPELVPDCCGECPPPPESCWGLRVSKTTPPTTRYWIEGDLSAGAGCTTVTHAVAAHGQTVITLACCTDDNVPTGWHREDLAPVPEDYSVSEGDWPTCGDPEVTCSQIRNGLLGLDPRWTQIHEDSLYCYYAICTEDSPPPTGSYGTPEPGTPCDLWEDVAFDPYSVPECCDCPPPPETCYTAAIPGSPSLSLYHSIGAKWDATLGDYVDWGSECGSPGLACADADSGTYVGYVQKPGGLAWKVTEWCCSDRTEELDPCDILQSGAAPVGTPHFTRVNPSPTCPSTSDCEDDSTAMLNAGWTFMEEIDNVCYWTICSASDPAQPLAHGTYVEGAPCEAFDDVPFTVTLTGCCECDPECWVLQLPGPGGVCSDAGLPDRWTKVGQDDDFCYYATCAQTTPNTNGLGIPVKGHPSVRFPNVATDDCPECCTCNGPHVSNVCCEDPMPEQLKVTWDNGDVIVTWDEVLGRWQWWHEGEDPEYLQPWSSPNPFQLRNIDVYCQQSGGKIDVHVDFTCINIDWEQFYLEEDMDEFCIGELPLSPPLNSYSTGPVSGVNPIVSVVS